MAGEATGLEQHETAKEFLSDQDKHALDLVKMRKALALANAEKALAQNESAELQYNNVVLQLSFKYGLKEKDVITEQGEIKRGAREG
jgi:hypothetical protein